MHSYHIHINGLVQGVGFRPFVCRLAKEFDITGWVSNTCNGVHINCNASSEKIKLFYDSILSNAPRNAIIRSHFLERITAQQFSSFTINESSNKEEADMLLTPDIAPCPYCKEEFHDKHNRRHHYAFTTCLNCGPRYSIIKSLPYDRENTTMSTLKMCHTCLKEYHDIENSRHYSQTNTCPHCAIRVHFYCSPVNSLGEDAKQVFHYCNDELKRGSIIAVKGVGGYLLMCDATNPFAVAELRTRKQRPAKPFAVLYADIEMAQRDMLLTQAEMAELQSNAAPIVLCKTKTDPPNGIYPHLVAPGLDKTGCMLPASPLLMLIAENFGKPLIATSANVSGSPIIYKDEDALQNLFEIADFVLVYDRDIVAPQDDSVVQFTDSGQRIVLRRSRGLAPGYFPHPFVRSDNNLLAMGAELKSSFALIGRNNLYISQFLGDQETVEAQAAYTETLQHLSTLVDARPDHILIDKHPGYEVSKFGKEIAAAKNISYTDIQHHKAHFGAVLAENNLLGTEEKILGVVWDGTGYGDDGQVWGGEFFMLENNCMKRVAHLSYFPQLLGDKMSREPRLSALSLLKDYPAKQAILQKYFSDTSWNYYQQLMMQAPTLFSSSMGRLLDGISAILGICSVNSYEGEAAMLLEVTAASCMNKTMDFYPIPLHNHTLDWSVLISNLCDDAWQNKDVPGLAWKVFVSLVVMIRQVSEKFGADHIAFSGGVFQNALLTDLVNQVFNNESELYFHQQLSPNDECIGFGQLACYSIMNQSAPKKNNQKEKITEQV